MANCIPIHQRQGLNSQFQNCEVLPFVMLTEDKIEWKNSWLSLIRWKLWKHPKNYQVGLKRWSTTRNILYHSLKHWKYLSSFQFLKAWSLNSMYIISMQEWIMKKIHSLFILNLLTNFSQICQRKISITSYFTRHLIILTEDIICTKHSN